MDLVKLAGPHHMDLFACGSTTSEETKLCVKRNWYLTYIPLMSHALISYENQNKMLNLMRVSIVLTQTIDHVFPICIHDPLRFTGPFHLFCLDKSDLIKLIGRSHTLDKVLKIALTTTTNTLTQTKTVVSWCSGAISCEIWR